MIKNVAMWEAWEDEYARNDSVDFAHNMAVFESLYQHAVNMGAFDRRAPLDGLESRIEMARILNGRRASGEDGEGA